MNIQALLNGTLGDAVEKLATLQAGTRAGVFQKTAAPAWLSSLHEAIKDPMAQHALIGGGIGAAALGTNTLLNNAQDPNKRRSVLGSVLAGGMLGAGAGAGIGMARDQLSGLKSPSNRLNGTDAVTPGRFVDPKTGKMMQVDPRALKDNPDLHAKLRELSSPSIQSRVSGTVSDGYSALHDAAPWTTTAATAAGITDLALHNPIKNLARIKPGEAAGKLGTEFLTKGLHGNKDINEALKDSILKNTHSYDPAVTVHTGLGPSGKFEGGIAKLLGDHRSDINSSKPLLSVFTSKPKQVETTQTYPKEADPLKAKANPLQETTKTVTTEPGKPVEHMMTESTAHQLKDLGYHNHPEYAGRKIYHNRLLGKTYAGASNIGSAAGKRALLYGAPIGLEYLIRGNLQDKANQKSMREIMEQYSKPVSEDK